MTEHWAATFVADRLTRRISTAKVDAKLGE
jgi:hypothetical protein